MNLKEAFRYQNKLQRLMDEAGAILDRDQNVTKVENTALRHKVDRDAEDETTLELPETEYAGQITEIAVFLMFLLDEREKQIISMRYGLFGISKSYTQKEIAERLGISRSYVSRIEKSAIEKLRNGLT